MSTPKVSFQVRLRSAQTTEQVAGRVTAALGCEFGPARSHEFEPGEGQKGPEARNVVPIA